MTPDRDTPILKGARYCSPACNMGCKRAAYNTAMREADKLAKKLGKKLGTNLWEPRVWENCGWHWSVDHKTLPLSIRPTGPTGSGWAVGKAHGYQVWCNTQPQIISKEDSDLTVALTEVMTRAHAQQLLLIKIHVDLNRTLTTLATQSTRSAKPAKIRV